jgi:hypothetical protein
VRGAGQQQRGGQALGEPADHVGGEHHELTRQAVGPDAGEQHEDDQRDGLGREDDAEVGDRPGQPEHGKGERHRDQAVAERRDGSTREQQRERGFAQGAATHPARLRVDPAPRTGAGERHQSCIVPSSRRLTGRYAGW